MYKIAQIKEYMKEHKITYEDLSKKADISISAIKKIFAGIIQNPRIDTLEAITKALGLEDEKNNNDLSQKEIELLKLFNTLSETNKNLVISHIKGLSIGENGILPNINDKKL